jgi:hypothetical protein
MKLLKAAFLISNSPKRKRKNRRRDAFASSAEKQIRSPNGKWRRG